MTGEHHYREAERLAGAYKDAVLSAESMADDTMEQFEKKALSLSQTRALLDKAQVHATLALADELRRLGDRTPREVGRAVGDALDRSARRSAVRS